MKLIPLSLIVAMLIGCSELANKDVGDSVIIFSNKEMISDKTSLQIKLSDFILKKSTNVTNDNLDIFQDTWLYSFKTSYEGSKSILVELKEHQPVAILNGGKYLTQSGKIISPEVNFKKLDLILLKGTNKTLPYLLDSSRDLQTKLNKMDKKLVSFRINKKDILSAVDHSGTEYIFSKKNFRVQLERLEDFISFELNSGNRDNIRYIDFRYNNAIAVKYG
ncbi:MAG: hypothetical protein CMD53_04875 [Gammaproteobacteria bacterium]|nr:hypothetical protein [Gammaproteobacteria bacterium]HJL96127.1 hypothetical protein [SAR86 cluster bacterium]HJM59459.1 hypothetical protein [SAR86 cluster bacterium]|tara:strand:+ start:27731 stop:28390 length:660 start_codon:yes stop_codon:yes gene_type:complete